MKKILVSVAVALGGMLAASGASAHGPAWSVTIGSGGFGGVSIGMPMAYPAPVMVQPAPVYVAPRVAHAPPVYAPHVYPVPVVYAPPVRFAPPRAYHGHGHGRGHWRHY